MKEKHQRLANISRLDIMDLDSIDCHILVFSILGVQQAGGGAGSLLYMEQFSSSLKQSDCISYEEHRDGNEEANKEG